MLMAGMYITPMLAPDIGALVEYKKTANANPWEYQFRVSGWVRYITIEIPEWCRFDDDAATKQVRVWSTREEATHVTLTGVCGAFAAIEDVTVTGMVDWPKDILDSDLKTALARVGNILM